jgi:phosphatidylinositol alpha-1,6-mannosyltransferase
MESRSMETGPQLILVTHEFPPRRGGVATYCRELAAALRRAGVGLAVWGPDSGSGEVDVVLAPAAGGRAPGLLRFTRALWARRHELTATVMFASLEANRAAILLDRCGCLPPMRRVSLLHGSEILRFDRSAFWRSLASRFYRHVDHVFAASPFVRRAWSESFLGALGRDVTVVPCAPGSDAVVAESTGAKDNRIDILTVARLHPRKGQLDLALALGRLPESVRDRIVYRVAGPGDRAYLGRVERACRAGGVAFESLGDVPSDRLAAVYAGCDIFAMTPQRMAGSVEGFGIVYLEAGIQGKPVVGWRSGGVADAVIDGETGLLVDEGDRAALTAAIERLVTDEALRRRLGEGGRRHAARFSWDQSAAIIRRVITLQAG